MQELDEKLRFWSNGKEADLKLLLSSLHQILWPNSGWLAIHSRDISGISQVKKSYQKVCLCLHSDKLQQRGATIREKYIAEKVFSVLLVCLRKCRADMRFRIRGIQIVSNHWMSNSLNGEPRKKRNNLKIRCNQKCKNWMKNYGFGQMAKKPTSNCCYLLCIRFYGLIMAGWLYIRGI